MKSNIVYNTDVLVHGAAESGNFKIAANGKAFKILIDGLYSNKIQAIVRELSSNAYDAQIAAGRGDIPFELQLPNALDPTFSVRDYGTSLEHADIMGLYTTLFESTKEDTNEGVGKFGLGSKTPFAYTDNFTVTAFLRGTKRVYGAYINVNGVPQISLMASEDTSEPDGLMISFPVNAKDCDRFRTETERVLEGFDVTPIVKGAHVYLNSNGEPAWTGTNFKLWSRDTGARAKQGCVIYPIDIKALSGITPLQSSLLKSNILITFPIGELDITPSRETLSYDDVTIANILAMADRIDAEITAEVRKEFAKCRTMYEARCFVEEYKQVNVKPIANFLSSAKFNGKIANPYNSYTRDRIKKVYNVTLYEASSYDLRNSQVLKFKGEKSYSTAIHTGRKTMFLIEDYRDPTQAVKLVNARIRNNIGDHSNIVWIRDHGATPKQWRQLKKLLGYPPKFHYLSDFQLPEKQKPVRNAFSEPRIARNEMRVEALNKNWNRFYTIIDTNDLSQYEGYLLCHNGEYIVGDDPINDWGRTLIRNFFEDQSKYLVIRYRHLERVKKLGLKNALVARRDELEALCDFPSYNERQARDTILNHWIKDWFEELSELKYDEVTSFKKLLDFVEKYGKTGTVEEESADHIIHLWSLLVPHGEFQKKREAEPFEVKFEDTLEYAVAMVNNDYPLLKRHFTSRDDGTLDECLTDIFNYIKMVDKEGKI